MHKITVHPEDLRDGWNGSIPSDDGTPVMVSLKKSDLKNLIVQMYRHEAELRRFAERPH